ncbi:hypothetical protein AXK57_21820 [Tsukamurella pulmonis]|uniref:MobF family relaxase n=1 Tax=Tsukamurella pulmonis TaxID=47312 RepID=UPI00079579D3|nr:MobF family relaxase [Tsukamurella pulmonis]KXP11583.1 hypothetical protein AXK57_21820 [Tsukamurella pulmonis]
MTLHPLHAGDGYTYLLREVATGDQRISAGQSLADYYAIEGCPPGLWGGRGAEILGVSGEVTESQMKALFGEGLHPDADRMIDEYLDRFAESPLQAETYRQLAEAHDELGRPLDQGEVAAIIESAKTAAFMATHDGRKPDPADGGAELRGWLAEQRGIDARSTTRVVDDAIAHARLGRRFAQFKNDIPLLVETRKALIDARAQAAGRLTKEQIEAVKHEVAVRVFTADVGRAPHDGAELKRFVAAQANRQRQPVAGYDCVFTPAKSYSVLWGLGDDQTRRAVEAAHHAAVKHALTWVQDSASYTRVGAAGVGQIDANGLTWAQFDHRDNRNGDPNLHTHATISTKVQGADGKWRSLDGRVLHRLAVAASERYNSAIEAELRARIPGIEISEVISREGARPVREIAGISEQLRNEFSRRPQIEARLKELADQYRAEHGKQPSKAVQRKLAQQATLDTREGKSAPKSLGDMRDEWATRAARITGGPKQTKALIDAATHRRKKRTAKFDPSAIDPHGAAAEIVGTLSRERSVWTRWHVDAEVQRWLGAHQVPADHAADLAERIGEACLGGQNSIPLTPKRDAAPDVLRRADGESIFTVAGAEVFTSAAVVQAEADLLTAAQTPTAVMATDVDFAAALRLVEQAEGFTPSIEQQDLARHFTHSGNLVAAGVGPAGAGKTTSMKIAAQTWRNSGGRVVAIAPSAVASDVLATEIGADAGNTLAKVIQGGVEIHAGDMLLVDEAGMASTMDLHALLRIAHEKGAVVRLLGDPQQLAAVEGGGALRLIAEATDAPMLRELHRFSDKEEAEITLRMREGDTTAIGWYHAKDRVVGGYLDQLPERVYNDWRTAEAAGEKSLMMAPTNEQVTELNARVLADRRIETGTVDDAARGPHAGVAVQLRDGLTVLAGDRIVTRRNRYDLRVRGTRGSRVRNGNLWTIEQIHDDGSLTVRQLKGQGTVTLPADYVARQCEVGYAATIHRAQGSTVDKAFLIVDPTMSRQALYVGTTRGKHGNQLYVPVDKLLDIDLERPEPDQDPADVVLKGIIARDGADISAHQAAELEQIKARSVRTAIPAYEHVAGLLDAEALKSRVAHAVGSEALANEIINDPAWTLLAKRLEEHRRLGETPEAVLAQIANHRELATAESAASVLHWRLDGLEHGQRRAAAAWATSNHDLLAQTAPQLAEHTAAAAAALTADQPLTVDQLEALDTITAVNRRDNVPPAMALADLARTVDQRPVDPAREVEFGEGDETTPVIRRDGADDDAPRMRDWLAAAASAAEQQHREPTADVDDMVPAWVDAPDTARWGGASPELVAWQEATYAAIGARARELAADVAAEPPQWAEEYGPAPEEGTRERAQWDRTVASVAAWREQRDWTHPRDPIGPQPEGARDKAAWNHVQRDAARLARKAAQRAERDQRQRAAAAERARQRAEQQRREAARRTAQQRRDVDPPAGPSPGRPGPRRPRI